MAKLTVDQKTVKELFMDKKSDFLIPDYQRPYAWSEEECLTLWEDIFDFAFPEYDPEKFNSENEYYLGPIVTYKNKENKLEIIDGQQRLTTIMLLLRAFYTKFGNMQDEKSRSTRDIIAQCIWKTDEFGKPRTDQLKIDSEVATDDDKEGFLNILKTGVADKNDHSKYATNYRFFQNKIAEFLDGFPSWFSYLPVRILNNCILLPIDADDQDTALRIFSTLNDRGLPLSDADIFKAQFYNFFKELGKKSEFIEKWKDLESLCGDLFENSSDTAMDELFTRYMYFERAKQNITSSTTEALRKFYERDKYVILRSEETFENLLDLAAFWESVYRQDKNRFSEGVLKQLFILNYAPNRMWTYIVSVYYLKNRNTKGLLEENRFICFLKKIIAFIWTYAIVNPGMNALRAPIYGEMRKIVTGETVDFLNYKFDKENVRSLLELYHFYNGRPITKSMLMWWMFQNSEQDLVSLDTRFDIEHIFAKKRYENERGSLIDPNNLESLGNKAVLEKRINIRAAEYRFDDKRKYYQGFATARNKQKDKTINGELIAISNLSDFTESSIVERKKLILDKFISYLEENGLLQ